MHNLVGSTCCIWCSYGWYQRVQHDWLCLVSSLKDGPVTQPPQDTQERSTHYGLEQFDFEYLRVISVTFPPEKTVFPIYAQAIRWLMHVCGSCPSLDMPQIMHGWMLHPSWHTPWALIGGWRLQRGMISWCVKMPEGILMWLNRKRWIAKYCTDSWFMIYDNVHV